MYICMYVCMYLVESLNYSRPDEVVLTFNSFILLINYIIMED